MGLRKLWPQRVWSDFYQHTVPSAGMRPFWTNIHVRQWFLTRQGQLPRIHMARPHSWSFSLGRWGRGSRQVTVLLHLTGSPEWGRGTNITAFRLSIYYSYLKIISFFHPSGWIFFQKTKNQGWYLPAWSSLGTALPEGHGRQDQVGGGRCLCCSGMAQGWWRPGKPPTPVL